MMQTVRPSIIAVPVTTPSAGRSGSLEFASFASSTNDPASTSFAMRSRAKSFPVSAFFWWYFGAPPFSTRARDSFSLESVDTPQLLGVPWSRIKRSRGGWRRLHACRGFHDARGLENELRHGQRTEAEEDRDEASERDGDLERALRRFLVDASNRGFQRGART